MASSVSTVGAVKLNLGSFNSGTSVPSTAFFGKSLKKVTSKVISPPNVSTRKFRVAAEVDEQKNTGGDRWKGLAYDVSDDQQDITRGKGMVDTLFQAPMGTGTHDAVLSSYEYISQGLRQYQLDNNMDGYYIAPAFMDKLVVHIAKNFMNLPNIKVPLILGIWGGKGQGKSFQCELVFAKMGINPIMMSAGELESGNAGEPAKLIRQRYREAADRIAKGKMCVLFINDLDAGAGRMGGTTQYTVNNQMVNATLMNIADNPTNVQLPGMYNQQENPRVPIIVTGNDFSTLYAPLIRDGRMEKFYWAPTREDRIGVCTGIFRADNVSREDIVKLVDRFPGQSIDFFGAIRARVYDDEVRKWISSVGVENIGKKLVNSREAPPTFEKPEMTIEKLLEYGNMLVQEQENVKRVQLADKYLKEAALGDANEDAINNGTFYGKAAQQVKVPVPEGCTDPNATNYDPTARSDDGSCSTMSNFQKGVEASGSLESLKSEKSPEVESNAQKEVEDTLNKSEESQEVETRSQKGVNEIPVESFKSEESPEVESNSQKEVPETLLKCQDSLEVESISQKRVEETPLELLKSEEPQEVDSNAQKEVDETLLKSEESQEVESNSQKEVDETLLKSEESLEVQSSYQKGVDETPLESLKSEESPEAESNSQKGIEESKSEDSAELESDSLQDLITLSYLLLRYMTAVGLKLIKG